MRRLAGLVACLSLLVTALPPAVSWADGAGPLRVLIVGDSITAGVDGDYTWRYRLAKEFGRQHVAVDFVGSRTWPYVAQGFGSATYADPNFDHDHFATGGALLHSQATQIEAEVRKHQADVVIVASGLNDLVHGVGKDVPGQVVSSLSSFIDHVRAANANATIVVSPVLTIDRDIPGLNAKIIDYDNRATSLVRSKSESGSPVVMAPTRNGWTSAHSRGFVQDGIHLTPKGDFFVADRIATALHGLHILGSEPPAVPSSVAWVRNLKPALRLSGHDVVVSWDSQALTGARIWVRRRWGPWHSVTTGRTTYDRALTPGATYDFRVQGIRRTMVSTNSSPSAIKARPLGRVGRVVVKKRRIAWTRVYGASTYAVRYRHRGSAVWHLRRAAHTSLHVRAVEAEVSAGNAFGSSAPTVGLRGH
jgi:lysophospholipase L1-like esterase